jgi:hypothetical protein
MGKYDKVFEWDEPTMFAPVDLDESQQPAECPWCGCFHEGTGACTGNEVAAEATDRVKQAVLDARDEAEQKAWDSLGRYKFFMAGYWMGAWVKFNRLLPKADQCPNPFAELVKLARTKTV